jgi:hypothetical protein
MSVLGAPSPVTPVNRDLAAEISCLVVSSGYVLPRVQS